MKKTLFLLLFSVFAFGQNNFRVSTAQLKELGQINSYLATNVVLVEKELNAERKPPIGIIRESYQNYNLNQKQINTVENIVCIKCYEEEWRGIQLKNDSVIAAKKQTKIEAEEEKPTIFKVITNQDVVVFFNNRFKLQNESLSENIKRCEYIIESIKKQGETSAALAFEIILEALHNAETPEVKNKSFITVYKATTSYNFYNSANKFAGRIYKEKFEPELEQKGDKTEMYLENYFNLLQE